MILRSIFAGVLLCALTIHAADARPRHYHKATASKMEVVRSCSDPVMRPCVGGAQKDRQILFERKYASPARHIANRRGGAHRPIPPGLHRVMAEGAGRVVAHPRGCPRRAFCGCGAAVHRFGRPIRSLWLARNWFRFPRAAPAPGMAAVKRHHVFILKRHVRGPIWIAYDANSGGHRTRIHPRSIAGWTIVNPRGV